MTMYQSNVLKVCDYVSLNLKDAIEDSTELKANYRWNIPQSAYMSNQRSQVCTVEVTGGVIGSNIPSETSAYGINMYYLNNGYNHYSSSGHPVIGSVSKGTTRSFSVTGTGQTLTQARPQVINIEFLKQDQTQMLKTTLSGCFTLKFSYYDAVGTGRDMQHEKTISL